MSTEALQIAKENARLNETSISFIHQDILAENTWSTLPQFDIIVSNPPYIPNKEISLMPKNVTAFEPQLALFVPNNDPLLFYRTIAIFAQQHLKSGGNLFFEVNEFHAFKVRQLLLDLNFEAVQLHKDINGKERMIKGQFDH